MHTHYLPSTWARGCTREVKHVRYIRPLKAPTDFMEVEAVRVVAGHPFEEGVAVLGGAEAGLDRLACGDGENAPRACILQAV